MALQGGLIQDQNNIPYDGTVPSEKISVSKAQKKNTGLSIAKNSKAVFTSNNSNASVRKILGDLTNSKKPQSHQASKKAQESKTIGTIIMEDNLRIKSQDPSCENEGLGGPSKSISRMDAKKVVPKTSEILKTRVRRALGDLTNSQIPNSIEHEGFMHNHDECIKSKKREEIMDLDYFLMTIGQDKSIKLVSPPTFSFTKSYENDDDDDLSHLKEWNEIPNSPPTQRTKSTNYSPDFMDLEKDDDSLDLEWKVESPDFKLKESP